jgi:hypothetical protein
MHQASGSLDFSHSSKIWEYDAAIRLPDAGAHRHLARPQVADRGTLAC